MPGEDDVTEIELSRETLSHLDDDPPIPQPKLTTIATICEGNVAPGVTGHGTRSTAGECIVERLHDTVYDPADDRLTEIDAEIDEAGPAGGLDALGPRVLLGRPDGLDAVIRTLRAERLDASLWSGISGLAWLLHRCGSVAPAALADIDRALLRAVEGWRGHHDLISGLVGIGVYALARGDDALLDAVVAQLETRSRTDEAGRFWWTDPSLLPDQQRRHSPDGHVDLGVAHGVPGVAWLLAAAAGRVPAAARMLPEVVGWLTTFPTFPAWTRLDGTPYEEARIAWCYGDLGVSLVLAQCGLAAERAEWTAFASDLALRAAVRPVERSGVVDSSVCHGSAGAALLFGRLAELLDDAALARAAEAWRVRIGEQPGEGLLEGAGGVELVRSGTDPTWDVALLARFP